MEDLALFTSSHPGSNSPEKRSLPLKARYGINAWKRWALSLSDQSEDAKVKDSSKPSKLNPIYLTISIFSVPGWRCVLTGASVSARPKSNLLSLSSDELSVALSRFVKEVCRPNGERYSPDSILYLCLGIQQVGAQNIETRTSGSFLGSSYESCRKHLNKQVLVTVLLHVF